MAVTQVPFERAPQPINVDARSTINVPAQPDITVNVPEQPTPQVNVSVPGLAELADEVRRSNDESVAAATKLSRQISDLTRIAAADRVPVFDDDGNPIRSRVDLTAKG